MTNENGVCYCLVEFVEHTNTLSADMGQEESGVCPIFFPRSFLFNKSPQHLSVGDFFLVLLSIN
jgi:hypothetical protein